MNTQGDTSPKFRTESTPTNKFHQFESETKPSDFIITDDTSIFIPNTCRKLFFYLVLLGLIIFHVLDLIYKEQFQKSSCRLTNSFQGGVYRQGFTYWISKILSSYLTNWFFILLMGSYLFSNSIFQFYHYLLIWIIPYTVAVTEKSIYARGRPFYLCGKDGSGLGGGNPNYGVQAWSCSCSFGMSSSHSCTAVSISWALWMVWRRWKVNRAVNLRTKKKSTEQSHLMQGKEPSDRGIANKIRGDYDKNEQLSKEAWALAEIEYDHGFADVIVGLLCTSLALAICWSRISLGSHSWNQVVIGSSIGLLSIILINYQFLETCIVDQLKKRYLIIITTILTLLYFSYNIVSFFINETRLKNSTEFIQRTECPDCLAKILLAQGQNHSQVMLLFGFTIGLAMNYRYSSEHISMIERDVNKATEPIFSIKTHLARLGLTIFSLVPVVIIWAQHQVFKKKNSYSIDSCLYSYVSMSAVYFLSGIILMRYTPFLWKKFNVHQNRDFVISYVDRQNRKRMYYQP